MTAVPAQLEHLRHSKMRDSSGNLKVYYHGTKHDFSQFSVDKILSEPGFWFSESAEYAAYHGHRLIQVHLNIVNPYLLEDFTNDLFVNNYNDCFKGAEFSQRLVESFRFRDYLLAHGYDGMMFTRRGYYTMIAFDPSQIITIGNINCTKED